jgi:hypothetical protein
VIPLSFSELLGLTRVMTRLLTFVVVNRGSQLIIPFQTAPILARSTQVAHHALKGCRCNRSDTEFEAW